MASALITGTSSGIGLATAVALGRAGHTVYATMRNTSRSTRLAEAVAAEDFPIQILTMDVDSDDSVAQAVQAIRDSGGQIDVLVNSAGIERTGSVEELPLQVFKDTMETNYFGAVRCIKAVVAEMRERGSGCIVNVTSIGGRFAPSPFAPYVASKYALEALSESLAQEVKPHGIRVAIVEPGIVDTPMARRVEGPSKYPQEARWAAAFAASLKTPTHPSVVADKIREIVESDTTTLRHPTGPDAAPFLAWRAGMTDEAFIEWGALNDDDWYVRVESEFGLNARRPS